MARENGPTIIKRKKVIQGGGHHGGAWKVAYADFVTAMMAFFLLMWLLNATTEQQKKGLADYFAPSIPIARVSGGSDGMFGGDSPHSTDSQASDGEAAALGVMGQTAFPQMEGDDGLAAAIAAETAALMDIEDVLLGRGGESLISDLALRHVVTRLTDEGLVIELFAMPGAPLFAPGDTMPLPVTREILAAVAGVASLVTNAVAVAGHVPAPPVMGPPNLVRVGPWDLSMGRAGRVREALEAAGLPPSRLARIAGHADRDAAVANPAALRNDRIEITLLRRIR